MLINIRSGPMEWTKERARHTDAFGPPLTPNVEKLKILSKRSENKTIRKALGMLVYLLESSSQHAAQVQLVACGVRMPSSISACKLRPPYRIERFQSLLDPRPHKFSNSLGVNHWSLYLMHRPRPPDPRRALTSSAVVVLQRTGNVSMFMVSFQLVVHCCCDIVWTCCCCCWWSVMVVDSCVLVPVVVVMVSFGPCCCCCWWITMWVAFISPSTSPTTALPEMKPLLSTQSICLKWGNWSGVMTLKAVPMSDPTGSETGTDTTVLPPSDVVTRRVCCTCYKKKTNN